MPYARSLAVTTLLAGAWCSGCGDDLPTDQAPDASPDAWVDVGEYDDPSDFDRDGCAPDGFADGAIEGIYHVLIELEGYTSTSVLRIDELDGGEWGGAVVGHDASQVRVNGSDVLLRYEREDGDLRAIDLCARDDDGTVHGHYVRCPATGEDECYSGVVTGKMVTRMDEPEAVGMSLLGEYGSWPVGIHTVGITVNVRVAEDIAYLARYQDGLRIVRVVDPTNPVELGHLPVEFPDDGEIYNDVKMIDSTGGKRYALMASNLVGVVVVEVTVPAAPVVVAHFGTRPAPGEPINVHTLFVDGGKAYLASGSRLEIYDLTDPAVPAKLGQYRHPEGGDAYLHDLYVSGNRAYLNFWNNGMSIVDVSDPVLPVLVGTFADYGEGSSHSSWVTQVGDRTIAVHGDEQYDAHVHVVDVTEGTAAFATSIGEWQTRPEVSVHNVMASGSLAVMAHYQDGVRVLDLSDPTAPVERAHYLTWPGYDRRYGYSFFESAVGIDWDIARGRVYVADSHRGLLILQLAQ